MSQDRISFDTAVSSSVQSDIQATVGQLEALMAEREKAVAAAMGDYQADGVSDDYQAVENRWKNAATEVKSIIALIKQTLNLNDQTASGAAQKARTAVQNIG